MQRLTRARGDWLALGGFALVAMLFYWPALVGGQTLLPLDNLWTMPPWLGPPDPVPHNQLVGDMILQNYPWKVILDQALRQRELPLWNPYVMGGLPYLATGQTGVLYPFVVIFLILGPLRAYGWYCALHQFLAAGLTYLFLRRVGLGRLGAATGGLVFAFSFFLTVSYLWPMVLGAAVWLPLALWSLVGMARAAEKGDLRPALARDLPIGALAVALSVFGGHLEITFYAAFAIALYGVYLAAALWRRRPRDVAARFGLIGVLAVGLGIALSSAQLVPFLDVLRTNNRQGDTTYRQVISYALPHRQILGLLMPDFFGNPTAHDYLDLTTLRREPVGNNALGQPTDPPHTIFWGTKNYVEAGGYVGVVPVLLAVVGALLSSRRERWFFVGLAAISLLLAFGAPLYALIYYGLPFFSQLRTPFRWLYPFDFAMAGLAALGAEVAWWRGTGLTPPAPSPRPRGEGEDVPRGAALPLSIGGWRGGRGGEAALLGWAFAAIGVAGSAALLASFVWRGRAVSFAARILARSPELQRAFGSPAMLYSYEFRNLAIFFGLVAAGGLVIGLLGRRPSPLLAAVLLLLVVGDLFFFGTSFTSKEPAAILDRRVDLNLAIPADLAGPRVASLGDPQVLPPNLGVLLGIPTVGGYDTIISSDYRRLWALVEPPVDLPYNKIGLLHRAESLGSPVLDLLSVRYVLSAAPVDAPAVRLIGQVGAVRVYERTSALPRAFVVGSAAWVPDEDAALRVVGAPGFQPGRTVVLQGDPAAGEGSPVGDGGGSGSARIVAYGLDQVAVDASSNGPAWLVLGDANAPGWEATVDGADAPVLTADGYLRAVPFPAGPHRIVFRYRPLALRLGAYLSFLALLVLAIVATYPAWRRAVGHYAGQAERVVRNTAVPMATSFFNRAIDFGFAALLLRILGPKAQGEWGWVIALVGYFEIVTGFGLNALIIREVARDRGKSGRYLANAIALRVALCALAAPVAAGLVLFGHVRFGLGDQAVVAFALLALALIPGNLTGALSAVFNAWERTEVPAIIAVGTNLARVSLSTTALLLGAGIEGLAAISLGLNLALVVVFAIAARRAIVVELRGPVPEDLPAMLAESYPLLLNNILVTVFFKIDTLLLLPMKGAEAVGYYTAAYKWLDGFLIIPSTFTFAIFPLLSRYATQKGEGLRAAYDAAIRILLCLALPIAVAVTVLSGDLILLLGGPAYYPASARALAILIWFLPISYVNGLIQYALIAVHRQRSITGAFVVAAAFNLGANLLFIPRYSFYASSLITVLSEVVLLVPFLYAAGRSIGWPDGRRVAGILLAGALLAAIAFGGRALNPYLALVAGLGIYPLAIWSLGAFSPAEIALLRGLLVRLRRRAAVEPAAV